jgi:hypothetical protein
VKLRLAGLTIAFLGLALAFAGLSWGASGRVTTAVLAALAGAVVFLLGRRLLLAAGRHAD